MLLAEDPVAGLRKVAGDGNNRSSMSTLGEEPLIEATDVGVPMGLEAHSAVGRFHKGPSVLACAATRGLTVWGLGLAVARLDRIDLYQAMLAFFVERKTAPHPLPGILHQSAFH